MLLLSSRNGRAHVGPFTLLLLSPFLVIYFLQILCWFLLVLVWKATVFFYTKIVPALWHAIQDFKESRNAE